MPPRIKFTRNDIIEAALELARSEGEGAVNARSVAARLGCSTQPLFREFDSMGEIRREVFGRAWEKYGEYISRISSAADRKYKGTGMAYIKFAKDEPELFRMLFMCDRRGSAPAQDPTLEYVLDSLMKGAGFGREEALRFHMHMWVYVHGLAVMQATHFVEMADGEIGDLLTEEYMAMLERFQSVRPKG
jgi:AcrR family transcriptional regulator